MKNSHTTVEIKNLQTGYRVKGDSKVVTSCINDALRWGELTCLLGPNGAGKSTLLKTLSAFLPPLAGEIEVMGKPIGSYSAPELSKTIGVVLTEKPMLSNMTVTELVAIGRSPYTGFWGNLDDADRRVVDEAIEIVGITELRNRLVSTLSDGERQKVMIAKALAQQTPIIFLDEPTAFLDYPSKVEIMQLLRHLAVERHLTVFLSTHDLELAIQLADRLWLVDKKLGVETGTPEDLSLSGKLEQYFHREGISFDMRTGLFRIDTPHHSTVQLTGIKDAAYFMAAKALVRKGFDCSETTGTPAIEVTSAGYLCTGNTFTTIGSLLDYVSEASQIQ